MILKSPLWVLKQRTTIELFGEDTRLKIDTVHKAWNLVQIGVRASYLNENEVYANDAESEFQGTNVRVYVIDTGISQNLKEFHGRVENGVSFLGENTSDANGHGTQVAGIIGSLSYGIATNCTLIPIKVVDDQGHAKPSDIIAALEWIVEQENNTSKYVKAIVNLSISGQSCNILDMAIRATTNAGIAVVVSAGNSLIGRLDSCSLSPSRERSAITVTAVDQFNHLAIFAGRGTCIDIAAPGVNIPTIGKNGESLFVSGTSMAAPHVSGILARLLQKHDFQNVKQLKKHLNQMTLKGRLLGQLDGTPNRILQYN